MWATVDVQPEEKPEHNLCLSNKPVSEATPVGGLDFINNGYPLIKSYGKCPIDIDDCDDLWWFTFVVWFSERAAALAWASAQAQEPNRTERNLLDLVIFYDFLLRWAMMGHGVG